MATKDYIIRLGEISYEGYSRIPTMEIFVESPSNEKKLIGYLTPFRGYRFQISATREGAMDLGSSPVIAFFKDCLPTFHEEDWIKGQIILSLLNFNNNRYGHQASDGRTIRIPDYYCLDKDTETMNKFIKESISWIRNH